ncbi:uncharacterized protein LOC116292405 [Actinia tenebrosa]|uniref:Uncharacterized protein LOC116292405 n=1 Tax=Actinia tenebrosa TaxID=6105 RepID=A0A6P8HKZ4_ACTTE|nr:uncharacterized protein LOC116292405 [Actinia tenebrosa]
MNFIEKLLSLLFITWLFVLTLQAPCNKRKINPEKALKRLRKKYRFVDAFRVKHEADTDSDQVVGMYCPWQVVHEDTSTSGVTQIPKFDVKAVCPKCRHYCKPVYYIIRVLQTKGCDKRTGEERWIQVEKRIPVAYVYNPSV